MSRSTFTAWIDNKYILTIHDPSVTQIIHEWTKPLIHSEIKNNYFTIDSYKLIDEKTLQLYTAKPLPIGEELFLLWGSEKIPVYPGKIVRTAWFDEFYSAPEARLGAHTTLYTTTFALWAPTATKAYVIIGDESYILKRADRGVWQRSFDENLHKQAYHYELIINGQKLAVNDPYAKGSLANSERSVVIDFSKTKKLAQPSPKTPPETAIIYELHVRDATIHEDSGVQAKGSYLGLTELNTKTKDGYSTGLSYIKELGISHVQLLPINDFARVDEVKRDSYNWGYDPLFFQLPEGSFATDAKEPTARINEVKTMIDSLHGEDLSVILDVVYNHVYIHESSVFEKIVPGYYFRYDENGHLSNGTGVGNDLATERVMMRKFILDTIDLWLSHYQVDGFRFDLMGIMDVETMRQIRKRSDKEKRPIILLGEGWDLPTNLNPYEKASSAQSKRLPGIGFFNDYFRNILKGTLFEEKDTGYVNGNGKYKDHLPMLLTGSSIDSFGLPFVNLVSQTINFVECHDNHTLWDRLLLSNPHDSAESRKKMHQLATGITLLSQGIPFLHAGQEWFRTKQGDENSYISGDKINQLDWRQRVTEQAAINFVKSLIALRNKYSVFHLRCEDEIKNRIHFLRMPDPLFAFVLLDNDADILVYINPTDMTASDLPLASAGSWIRTVSNYTEQKKLQTSHRLTLQPYELLVLVKKRN